MRTLLAILLLAALPVLAQDKPQTWNMHGGALGSTSVIELPAKHVVVKFYSPGEPTTCPVSGPTVTRNEDGSYTRSYPSMVLAISCHTPPREWYEFWTDYPDKGGKFIGEWRKVEK